MESNKSKRITIRARSLILTAVLVATAIIYLAININIFDQNADWATLIMIFIVQIVTYVTYFPEGEIWGEKDPIFMKNREAYNEMANSINEQHKFGKLREFCDIEYEKRKNTYFLGELGQVGITEEEYEQLASLDEKHIKELSKFTFKYKDKGERLVCFSKSQRKILYRLMFKKLPIERNSPDVILSSIERDSNKSIHDDSRGFKTKSYILKTLSGVLWAIYVAYISIGGNTKSVWEIVFGLSMFLYTLIMTIITSFSTGEKSTKIYKNRFYVEAYNFMGKFADWENSIEQTTTNENN